MFFKTCETNHNNKTISCFFPLIFFAEASASFKAAWVNSHVNGHLLLKVERGEPPGFTMLWYGKSPVFMGSYGKIIEVNGFKLWDCPASHVRHVRIDLRDVIRHVAKSDPCNNTT
jgi:hypothetical protein